MLSALRWTPHSRLCPPRELDRSTRKKKHISKRMVARASWDPPESFVRELDGSTCLAQFIGPTGILQLGLEADAAGQTC
jgi:hypothetical protein